MTKADSLELRSFSEPWQLAINQKEWDNAISLGISGYHYFNSRKIERSKQAALGLIHAAFEIQNRIEDPKQERNSCSFCGKTETEVRLGAGASAFICEECVQMFSRIFSND